MLSFVLGVFNGHSVLFRVLNVNGESEEGEESIDRWRFFSSSHLNRNMSRVVFQEALSALCFQVSRPPSTRTSRPPFYSCAFFVLVFLLCSSTSSPTTLKTNSKVAIPAHQATTQTTIKQPSMDDLIDHKDDSAGSSTLTDTHSPAPKSPSEDLMGLEFDTTPIPTPTATTPPPVTATVGVGSDTDTGKQEADLISTSFEGDGDDGFGDFGTVAAAAPVTAATTGNDKDDDDGFGDFGTAASQDAFGAKSTSATGAGDDDDDDDGFGDFGTGPTAAGDDPFAGAADDDGFGDFGQVQAAGDGDDDDFGDFNDFGDDGFQNSDDFGDFGGSGDANGDDPFGASSSEPVQPEVSAPAPPPEPAVPVEVIDLA